MNFDICTFTKQARKKPKKLVDIINRCGIIRKKDMEGIENNDVKRIGANSP